MTAIQIPAVEVKPGRAGRGLIPFVPPDWSVGLAELLGFFVADGCATQHQTALYFCGHAEEIAYLEEALPRLIPGCPWHRYDKIPGTSGNERRNELVATFEIARKRVWSWFDSVGLAQPQHLRPLPIGWERLPVEQQSGLLRGLFEGDGSVFPQGCVELGTTSKLLADQVESLLGSLGIESYTRKQKPNDLTRHQAYLVTIRRSEAALFQERVGFLLPYKQECLSYVIEHGHTPYRKLGPSDYRYTRFSEVFPR